MVFCFTVNTLYTGLFEIWKFSFQRIYSDFKVIEAWSSDDIQTLITNLTLLSVSHVCWKGLFTNCDTWLGMTHDCFPVILCKSWRVPHVGQYSFWKTLFHSFIIYTLLNLSVLLINDWLMTGLFAWISPTILSQNLFYYVRIHVYGPHYTARGYMSDKDMSWNCCDSPWLYHCV